MAGCWRVFVRRAPSLHLAWALTCALALSLIVPILVDIYDA